MSDALTTVLLQRERLLNRVARQRDGVAFAVAGLQRPIALIDRIAGFGRVLSAHPAMVVALVAGLVALRARTVIGMVGRGIGLWRLFRRVRSLIARVAT